MIVKRDDMLRHILGRTTSLPTSGISEVSGGVVSFSAPLPKPKPKPEKDKGK